MKVYSTDTIGKTMTIVLKESPYNIMWTRGAGFYVNPTVTLKRRLDGLADYCVNFEKRILLFSNENGLIRSDIFWTRSPGELFWKQCMDLSDNTDPSLWSTVIDTVYRNHTKDTGILVLGDIQSSVFFYT